MKRYIKSFNDMADFEQFDKQKYYKLYSKLFRTITDGMNADLRNNIKAAFKLVNGRCGIDYYSDRYIKFDGVVGDSYTVGGSISLEYLQGDARRLAEDLAMAYFKTTEGAGVDCNTYGFLEWINS